MRDECTSRPDCDCEFCKPVLDPVVRQWMEEYFDRSEDERVFGTPMSKERIQ